MNARLECKGYATVVSVSVQRSLRPKISSAPTKQPLFLLFEDNHQYHYHQTFCSDIATHLSGYFGSELWKRIIPQACFQESFIRHGVIAIAALALASKKVESKDQIVHYATEESMSHYNFAIRHYGKAVRELRLSSSVTKLPLRMILLACILIICFETFHGDTLAALAQIQSGLNLLAEWRSKHGASIEDETSLSSHMPGVVEDEIIQTFGRLNIQAMSFVDSRPVQYHHAMVNFGDNRIGTMPLQFHSLKEARIFLDLIMQRFMHFTASVNAISGKETVTAGSMKVGCIIAESKSKYQAQNKYQNEMLRWHNAFQPILDSRTTLDAREDLGATILQLHYLTTCISIATTDHQYAPRYLVPQFSEIISLSSKLLNHAYTKRPENSIFNFDFQVIVPLYVVALQCPVRKLRRHAISLLLSTPRRESLWDSRVIGRIAVWVSSIEEEGLEGEYVPDERRVVNLDINLDMQARKARLQCRQPKPDEKSGFLLQKIDFAW